MTLPFLLKPASEPPQSSDAGLRSAVQWEYDAILDGLLSGGISGCPMNPQDARLLLRLLEGLDWAPDPGRLVDAMPYLADRLDMHDLRGLMRHLGFRCKLQKVRWSDTPKDRAAGLIAVLDDKLWAVEINRQNKPVLTRPPGEDTDTQTRRLNRTRKYQFVHFEPELKLSGPERRQPRESFIMNAFSRFAPDLRLALQLTLLSGILTVLFSVVVIFLFDLVVTGQQTHVITAILAAAGALFLFDLGFRSLKARILGRVSGRFEFLLGGALFGKLLKLPRHMIDQAPISEQTIRLRELEGMRDLFAGPFAIVALELPGTVLIIVAITIFSPVLGLVLLGLILVFLVAGMCIVPALARRAAVLSMARSALMRLQMELIDKQHVIARNGLAGPWAKKAENTIGAVVNARFRLAKVASSLEALSYLFLPCAAGCVIFLGAERAIAGVLNGGELVAVTMLTWRAVAPIQQGLLIIPKLGDLLRLFKQIDTIMRFAEEDHPHDVDKRQNCAAKLTANNVFLRGPQARLPTLAGVSLEIPKGLFVSVTGASGSGKSALLGVLSGQVHPQAGSVRLDEINLSEMSSHALGRRIMLVPENPVLIYGSLAQNLRLVDPLISDDTIDRMLAEVGLSRLLARLSEGAHSRIDPSLDNTLLSGGVRTAVAIAQALLIEPSVLLLDEASDDIDPAIDMAIHAALKRRQDRMTSLVVTHRPSTIRGSDAVLQIAGGRTSLKFNTEKKEQAV